MKKALNQLQSSLTADKLGTEKLCDIFSRFWERLEIYAQFYRFKDLVRPHQSKGKLFKSKPVHVLYDPSGKMDTEINIFDLIGCQVFAVHKVALKQYQSLYKMKDVQQLRLFHECLLGQSKEDKMTEVEQELKLQFHDAYFLQEHLGDFLEIINEFLKCINLFVHRAISQLHTDLLHEYLKSTFEEFEPVYSTKMNQLGQSLTKLIDQCFNSSSSTFEAVQAARLVSRIII